MSECWESHTDPKDTNVMHRNRIELQNAYERIMNSRSALDEFGEIVIENDGHWNPSEVADPTKRCCQTNEPKHQYSYDSLTLRDHQRTPLGESGVTV